MASSQTLERVSVRRLVLVVFTTRTILNIVYRAVYPFLPFIANDLGVSFQSAAEIVQVRNLVGLTAPFFGPMSDRSGRRTLMVAGLVISILACLAIGFVSTFVFAVIAIAAINLGRAMYEPAQQAYMGDRVPYAKRGRAMSLSEVSWAAASIAGLPLFGIVVQYLGWRTGFALVGIACIFGLALTRGGLPREDTQLANSNRPTWRETLGEIIRQPIAVGVLLTSVLLMACNENVNIVYAEWMESSFLLDAVALGSVAFAMGFAELGGELLSSVSVDRVGKHRLVGFMMVLTGAAYALLPWIGKNAVLGTIGLALVYFLFEVTVVSGLPLITEVVPTARGTLMSFNLAAVLFGRTLGSFTGPLLFVHQGFMANGLTSAAGMLIALAVWHVFVTERA